MDKKEELKQLISENDKSWLVFGFKYEKQYALMSLIIIPILLVTIVTDYFFPFIDYSNSELEPELMNLIALFALSVIFIINLYQYKTKGKADKERKLRIDKLIDEISNNK